MLAEMPVIVQHLIMRKESGARTSSLDAVLDARSAGQLAQFVYGVVFSGVDDVGGTELLGKVKALGHDVDDDDLLDA